MDPIFKGIIDFSQQDLLFQRWIMLLAKYVDNSNIFLKLVEWS